MTAINTSRLKRWLVPTTFVVGTVFLFFNVAYSQTNPPSATGLAPPQLGNDSLCAKAVREKYLGEMNRNFNALNSKQTDARTFDARMKDFDLRSYEDYKRCLRGEGIGTTVQPVLPPASGGGDSGPDWWGKVKPAPAPPVIRSQPLPQLVQPPLRASTILAIDGIGFLAEIFGKDFVLIGTPYAIPASGENYLRSSLQSFLEAQGIGTNVEPMPWGRETRDTRAAITQLKAYIMPRGAKGRNGTFTIVAHSWAGALTYAALQELRSSHPDISVDTLVTLGTPVGYFAQLNNAACSESQNRLSGFFNAIRKNILRSPRLVAQTLAWTGLCTTDSNGKYKGKGMSVPPNIRRWINWYAAEDGFSALVVAMRTDGRPGVLNYRADDLRKIRGEHLTCCPPASPYIANNHMQYYAWNYNGKDNDGVNIRANAARVLGELSK